MSTLRERWGLWAQKESDNEGELETTFALRIDRVAVCLEPERGTYFLIVAVGPGLAPDGQQADPLYRLEDPVTGEQADAHIEPLWLAGYFDCFVPEDW